MNFKLIVINILLIFVVFPQSVLTTKTIKPIVQIPSIDDRHRVSFIGFEGNGIYKKAQLYAFTKENKLKQLPNFQFVLPEEDTNYFVSGHLGDITGEGMQDFVLILTNPNSGSKVYTWSIDSNNMFSRLSSPFLVKTNQTESYPTSSALGTVYPDKDKEIIISFGSPDRKTVLLDYLGEIKQTEELGKEFLSNLAGPIIMKLSDQNNDGLDDIYVLNNGEIKKETSFLSPEREPLTKKQNFKNPIIDLMLLEKNPKKIFLLSTREVFLESWGKKIQLNEPVNKFIHLKDKTISMLDKKGNIYNYFIDEENQRINLLSKITPPYKNENFTQLHYLVIEDSSAVLLSHNGPEIIYQPLYFNIENQEELLEPEPEMTDEKEDIANQNTESDSEKFQTIINELNELSEKVDKTLNEKEQKTSIVSELVVSDQIENNNNIQSSERVILNSDTVSVNIGQNTNIFIDLKSEYNFIDLETIQKPDNMSFTIEELAFNWTPTKKETGYHHLEYDIEYLSNIGIKKEIKNGKLTIVNETEKIKEIKHFIIFVNTPPQITLQEENHQIQSGRTLKVPFKAIDLNKNQKLNISYSPETTPSVEIINNQFIWTPEKENHGTNVFKLFVNDGMILDSANLTIRVDTLQQKIIDDEIKNATLNKEFVLQVPVQSGTKYSIVEAPQNLRITQQGEIHWIPINTQIGNNSVKVEIEKNNEVVIYEQEIFVNAPPIISYRPNDIEYVEYGGLFKHQLQSFDQNANQQLTWTLSKSPENMILKDGILSWTADGLDYQNYTIELFDGIDKDVFNGIIYVNDLPKVVNMPPQHITLGETFIHSLEILDKNQQSSQEPLKPNILNVKSVVKPAEMILKDKTLTWKPTVEDLGNHSIELELSDGVNKQLYKFIILVNDAPVITSVDSLRVQVGDTLSHILQAKDQNENTALTYGIRSNLNKMMLNAQTGEISWIPTIEDLGKHEIQVSVTDGFTPNNSAQTIHILVYSLPKFLNSPPSEGFVGVDYMHIIEAQDGFGNMEINKDIFIALDSTTFIDYEYNEARALLSIVPKMEELGTQNVSFSLRDSHNNIINETFEINIILSPCEPEDEEHQNKATVKEQRVEQKELKEKTRRQLRKERRQARRAARREKRESENLKPTLSDTLFITEYDTIYNTKKDTVYKNIPKPPTNIIENVKEPSKELEVKKEDKSEPSKEDNISEPIQITRKETIVIDNIETVVLTSPKSVIIPPPHGHKVGYTQSFDEQKWGQETIPKQIKIELESSQKTQVSSWNN